MGTGIGTATITVLGGEDVETELTLNDVIYAPNMSSNLFSLAAVYDKGFETRITPGYGLRIFHEDTLVAQSLRVAGGLFQLKTPHDSAVALAAQVREPVRELDVKISRHRRLAHLGEDNIRKLAKMVDGMGIKYRTSVGACEACLEGNSTDIHLTNLAPEQRRYSNSYTATYADQSTPRPSADRNTISFSRTTSSG